MSLVTPRGGPPAESSRLWLTGRVSSARTLTALSALTFAAATPAPADAADWVFQRSYFSHAIPPELADRSPVPISYSAYRPAIVSPYPGFAINGVRRFNRVLIQNGNSLDYTILRSDQFRLQP
jgi:hypothetical protein